MKIFSKAVPIVLVDASYSAYFNLFSTWSWYVKEFNPILTPGKPFDVTSDVEFLYQFERNYLNRIKSIVSSHFPFFEYSNLIFCLDCSKSNIWRRDYFPQYKQHRIDAKPEDSEIDLKHFFQWYKTVILEDLKEKYGVKIIQHPHCEGDDIVAIGCNFFKNRSKIVIGSDRDLTQLKDENTKVITLTGKELEYPDGIENRNQFILLKAMIGDGADNIPKIRKGVGEKTALKYISEKEKFKKLIESEPEINEILKRNILMVDLNRIPKNIVNEVFDLFKKEFSEEEISLNEI